VSLSRRRYISFGKRALELGLTAVDLETELVPSKAYAQSRSTKKPTAGPSVKTAPTPSKGSASVAPTRRFAWEDERSGLPMGLPNHVLEFQLRLTPEDFAAFKLRRRQVEAEIKLTKRLAAGADKEEDTRGSWAREVDASREASSFARS
jgi:hypothetical protein